MWRTALVLFASSFAVSSCYTTTIGMGPYMSTPMVYADHYSPLKGMPGGKKSMGKGELSKGQACMSTVLALFTTGDASITTAMKNSGIKIVESVSYQRTSVFGYFVLQCTTIRGWAKG